MRTVLLVGSLALSGCFTNPFRIIEHQDREENENAAIITPANPPMTGHGCREPTRLQLRSLACPTEFPFVTQEPYASQDPNIEAIVCLPEKPNIFTPDGDGYFLGRNLKRFSLLALCAPGQHFHPKTELPGESEKTSDRLSYFCTEPLDCPCCN